MDHCLNCLKKPKAPWRSVSKMNQMSWRPTKMAKDYGICNSRPRRLLARHHNYNYILRGNGYCRFCFLCEDFFHPKSFKASKHSKITQNANSRDNQCFLTNTLLDQVDSLEASLHWLYTLGNGNILQKPSYLLSIVGTQVTQPEKKY